MVTYLLETKLKRTADLRETRSKRSQILFRLFRPRERSRILSNT